MRGSESALRDDANSVSDTMLLDYAELVLAVESVGIPLPAQRLVRTPDEAAAFAAAMGKKAVLKLVSSDLVHKSDVGGVRLNVIGAAAVHAAATEIEKLALS